MPSNWRPGACFKCGKPGHWALHCPRYSCTLCGQPSPGHYTRDCSNYDLWKCTNCNFNGHLYITCPKPRRIFACSHCGQTGHGLVMCPRIDCWVCKDIGHTPWNCPTYSRKLCVRCGEYGHFSPMCDRWVRTTEDRKSREHNTSTEDAECPPQGNEGRFFFDDEEASEETEEQPPPSEDEDDTSSADEPQSAATDGPESDRSSPDSGTFHPSWSHARVFIMGFRHHPSESRPATPERESPPEQIAQASESGTSAEHDVPLSEDARDTAQRPHHDGDCRCMLCILTKGQRYQAKPSAAKHAPSSTTGTAPNEEARRPDTDTAHNATCTCSLCNAGTAEPGASSPKEQQASTPPRPSSASPRPDTSQHGPTCACPTCGVIREGRTPSEYPTEAAAALQWKLGTAALQSGQTDSAIHAFTICIERDPYAGTPFKSRGEAFVLKLNYAAALSDFQRAYELLKVAVPSEVSPVLVKIARCRLCLGSHSSALLAIQEALALDPTHDAARTLKRRLMQMQESEEALRQARAAARWHVARSTWEACIQLYEEENCPVPTGLRCWKVDLAVLERDWERAQSAAEEVYEAAPQAITAILARINVLFLVGDLQQASKFARSGLQSDPDNVRLKSVYKRIKGVLRLQGDAEQQIRAHNHAAALQTWKEILASISDLPEDGGGGPLRAAMLYNQAEAEARLKQFSEGLRSIEASLKLDEDRWTTYRLRGRIYAALQLFDTSVENFKAALEHIKPKAHGATVHDIARLREELTATEERAANAKSSPKDYYKILQLSPTCSLSEIRKAYKIQTFKHHPDKGGIEEQFKLVNEAYTTLSNSESRRIYDLQRARQPRRSSPR